MIAVVTGGAASGKSAFAESLALSLPGPHAYVATMRNSHDEETEARIARHRSMRAGKGFVTVELQPGGAGLVLPRPGGAAPTAARKSFNTKTSVIAAQAAQPLPAGAAAQAANSLQVGGERAAAQAVGFAGCACRTALLEDLGNLVANGLQGELEGVLACENVVIVANEVGCDGVCYDAFTMEYIAEMGLLACELAARADLVVEVVAGVPCVAKGELPCAC